MYKTSIETNWEFKWNLKGIGNSLEFVVLHVLGFSAHFSLKLNNLLLNVHSRISD